MKIDIVILWVDGADPVWQKEKQAYEAQSSMDGNSPSRYRDWGLLPYWFRGVERFAPWVNQIHFVTWGHVPAVLNLNAPKLHVVRHSDFIPEAYLPTFSSHTIELHLHRIPGLGEHFIYFNDDMFLLRPTVPEDFFRDGLPRTCGREVPWQFVGDVGIWAHAAANNLGIINRHFPKKQALASHAYKYRHPSYRWKDNIRSICLQLLYPDHFTGFPNLHAPAAYRKETFQAVWAADPEVLARTCSHRFRHPGDVNQWLFLWWQVASGQFSPCMVDNLVQTVSEENIDDLCRCIEEQSHTFLCINDPERDDIGDFARRLQGAFEALLPEKSAFEI